MYMYSEYMYSAGAACICILNICMYAAGAAAARTGRTPVIATVSSFKKTNWYAVAGRYTHTHTHTHTHRANVSSGGEKKKFVRGNAKNKNATTHAFVRPHIDNVRDAYSCMYERGRGRWAVCFQNNKGTP